VKKSCIALALVLTLFAGMCVLADGSLDAVKEKGTLILGLDDSFAPMGYRNEDNEIVGFDIDLAREVCSRLGVELILQPIEWLLKEQQLTLRNIDCIWNGMSRTDEREKSMALSMNYMNNKIVLMVNDPVYMSRDDLAGKIVAVQSGSYAEEVLASEDCAEFNASLKGTRAYADYVQATMALKNGNVDAIAIDLVVANYRINSFGDASLRTIDNLADDLYCVGFRLDDIALRDAVDSVLTGMAGDGSLDAICQKWFGENISIITAE